MESSLKSLISGVGKDLCLFKEKSVSICHV